MARGRDVNVEFGGDTVPYEDSLRRMEAQNTRLDRSVARTMGSVQAAINGALGPLKMFGAGIAGLASAAGAGVIGGFFRSIATEAGRFVDLAERVKTTASNLYQLAGLAEESGVSVETLARSLVVARRAAQEGDAAFAALGISQQEFLAMRPEDQIAALAEAYQRAERSGHGLSEMQKILGKGFQELLPVLGKSAQGIRDAMGSGWVPDETSMQNIDRLVDRLAATGRGIKALAMDIASPGVQGILDFWDLLAGKMGAVEQATGAGLEKFKQAQEAAVNKEYAAREGGWAKEYMATLRGAGALKDKPDKTEDPNFRSASEGEGDMTGPGGVPADYNPYETTPADAKRLRDAQQRQDVIDEAYQEQQKSGPQAASAQAPAADSPAAPDLDPMEAAIEANLAAGMDIGDAKKAARKQVRADRKAARAVAAHRKAREDLPGLVTEQFAPATTPAAPGIWEQVGGRTPSAPSPNQPPPLASASEQGGGGATLDDIKQALERANEYLETMSVG